MKIIFSSLFVLFLLCVSRVEACSCACSVGVGEDSKVESSGVWEDKQFGTCQLKWTWDASTGTLIVSDNEDKKFDLKLCKDGRVDYRRYRLVESSSMFVLGIYTSAGVTFGYTNKLASKPESHKFKTVDETVIFSSSWNGDHVLITGSTINDFKVYPDGTIKRHVWEEVK